jgi:hypothetical protein
MSKLIKRADGSYSQHGLWDSIRENKGSGNKPTKAMLIQKAKIKSKKYEKGGLLAPNGKPSNLNPEQYKVVRTPAFKRWFGDWENDPQNASKVIDENGEPQIMLHGSNSKHTVFEINQKKGGAMGSGIYLTTDIIMANFYGLNVYRLFVNIKNPKYVNTRKEDTQMLGGSLIYLQKKGKGVYDGICNEYNIWLAINPNQVKLADGTNTTFDSNNPDIRYKQGGKVKTYWYKGLFN